MSSPNPPAPPGGSGLGTQIANGLNSIAGAPSVNDSNSSGLGNATNGNPSSATVGGAVGSLLTGALGLKVNTINIILNTVFYAGVTTMGIWFLYSGLKMLVKEVPGAPGASKVLTAPFKAVGALGLGAGFAAQKSLPVVSKGLAHGAKLDKLVGGKVGNGLLSAAAP